MNFKSTLSFIWIGIKLIGFFIFCLMFAVYPFLYVSIVASHLTNVSEWTGIMIFMVSVFGFIGAIRVVSEMIRKEFEK